MALVHPLPAKKLAGTSIHSDFVRGLHTLGEVDSSTFLRILKSTCTSVQATLPDMACSLVSMACGVRKHAVLALQA